MRLLFEIDTKDYNPNGTVAVRPSVRGIIIRDNRLAMIHSLKYDYYKFPGGGMEKTETQLQTLIREVAEESGLQVIPSSVRAYGYVHRIQKGIPEDVFIQDNYYYLCESEETVGKQSLDDYEDDELFTLEWVTPETALNTNISSDHGEKQRYPQFGTMLDRECRVIENLLREGYFRQQDGEETYGNEKE